MNRKQLMMSAAAITFCAALCLPVHPAQAQEMGNIAYLGLSDQEQSQEQFDWGLFFENQHREPCQHYVEPPAGWVVVGCQLQRIQAKQAMLETAAPDIEPAAGGNAIAPLTIYFDFDHSDIRPDEQAKVDEAIADVNRSNPSQVVVSGYADTAGPTDYNDGLSDRRAQTITNALTTGGVSPSLIQKQSFGERVLAVPTPDNTPKQENRRVTVEFK